jgi:PAS domain S-box-containing protein
VCLSREVLDELSEGVILERADGAVLDVNAAALRMAGVCREEVVGRPVAAASWTLVDEDGSPLAADRYPSAVALRTGEPVRARVGLRGPAGQEVRWVRATAVPRFTAGQRWPHQVLVTLQDEADDGGCVSARQAHTEDELQRSRANLSALIESTSDVIWSMDLDHRMLVYNSTLAAHFRQNYGAEVRAGAKLDELIPAERAARWPAICWTAIQEGLCRLEYDLPDGRILELCVQPMLADGQPIGYSVFGKDITDRKRAETRLAHLVAAVEQNSDQVLITDPDGQVLYVNPAFARQLGCEASALVGRRYARFAEDFGLDVEQAGLETLLRSGAWRRRHESAAPDGRKLVFDVTVSAIADAAGRPIGRVSTRRDVTRQVDSEARQAQAQRMEAMGILAGGIAHDFNNILAAIVCFADLARTSSDPGEQRDCLREVMQASSRAVDLVKHILSFSRMSKEDARPLHPQLIVKEAMKLMRASIPSNIAIRTSLCSNAVVRADPGEIHRVIVNLCTNAALAMSDSDGVLEVSLDDVVLDAVPVAEDAEIGPGRFVRLRVKDSGCGMSEDVRARIFEPFFTTRREGEGTGMGLSVVHGIVRSRGGTISVVSTEGQGTTIEILLPAERGEHDGDQEPEVVALPGTERVLLVDDEVAIAEGTGRALRRLGYHVTVCTRSLDALERFEAQPDAFDVVVSDVTMPAMTGDRLAERIRAIRPGFPVILCSGYTDRIDDARAGARGVFAYLAKPVAATQLSHVIRRAMHGDPSPRT